MKASHGFPLERAREVLAPAFTLVKDNLEDMRLQYQRHIWEDILSRHHPYSLMRISWLTGWNGDMGQDSGRPVPLRARERSAVAARTGMARLISRGMCRRELYEDCPLFPNELASVYLGCRIHPGDRDHILTLLAGCHSNASVFRARKARADGERRVSDHFFRKTSDRASGSVAAGPRALPSGRALASSGALKMSRLVGGLRMEARASTEAFPCAASTNVAVRVGGDSSTSTLRVTAS